MNDITTITKALSAENPVLAGKALTFLLDNRLFGRGVIDPDGSVRIGDDDCEDLRARCRVYLGHLEETMEEKTGFLETALLDRLPLTAGRLRNFFEESDLPLPVRYRLLDWMVYALPAEVPSLSSAAAERLVRKMNQETSLQAVTAFCLFLGWMKRQYPDVQYQVSIIPPQRRSVSTAGQAFSLRTVAFLYYYLFSEEGIRQERIIEKACGSEQSAHAWAYLCVHLVSALRDTDLSRLPRPQLPCPPAEFLKKAADGSVGEDACANALRAMMKHLGYLHMKPHKVRTRRNIADVCLSIPQSMEPHFGLIFLICEAHRQANGGGEDGPLFKKVSSYNRIRSCLGENIGALFLERDASPVALAKSYLQLVELKGASAGADRGLSAVHGYMLASMARSHKGGPEGFAVTTASYLRDFGLGIISPEMTARAMFDRGILSCLPSMLMDLLTEGAYRAMDFSQQAIMMEGFGLSPLEVENTAGLFLEARSRVSKAITKALSSFPEGDRKAAAAAALRRIAGYQAAGKEPDILCLMTALGKTCVEPDTANCILCPYRICTRAAVYHAAGELHRLRRLGKQAVTAGEKKKYRLLAQQCLLPTIQLASDIAAETYGPGTARQLLSLLESIVNDFIKKEESYGHTAP